MTYNLHNIIKNLHKSGKFQVLLVVLVAIQSLPRLQPMHPRIHRSTRLRGASGWSRWPVGPQAFHQLGWHAGAWRPWRPPMANGQWMANGCLFCRVFSGNHQNHSNSYSAFRRFFDGIDGKNAYIDCSFLEKQVCSSPNIIKSCRH